MLSTNLLEAEANILTSLWKEACSSVPQFTDASYPSHSRKEETGEDSLTRPCPNGKRDHLVGWINILPGPEPE